MTKKIDVFHILLVAGLGSSIFGRFKYWARLLQNRLGARYKTAIRNGLIKVHVVTSDGTGEDKAYREIEEDLQNGKNVVLIVGGHSNGGRDGPYEASSRMTKFPGFKIAYAFVIDMTLGEMGGVIYDNVAWLDEFWAGLQKTDFVKGFRGVHCFYDLDRIFGRNIGHVASATVTEVQDRIFENITNVIEGRSLNGRRLK